MAAGLTSSSALASTSASYQPLASPQRSLPRLPAPLIGATAAATQAGTAVLLAAAAAALQPARCGWRPARFGSSSRAATTAPCMRTWCAAAVPFLAPPKVSPCVAVFCRKPRGLFCLRFPSQLLTDGSCSLSQLTLLAISLLPSPQPICCGFHPVLAAPALAMRYAFAAKQHKLLRWLAPVPPGRDCREGGSPPRGAQQAQQAQQQAQQSLGPATDCAGAAGASAPTGSQASCGASQGGSQVSAPPGGAAGKKEGKKQASLKAFFQRPTAQRQQSQGQQAEQQLQQEQQQQWQQQQQVKQLSQQQEQQSLPEPQPQAEQREQRGAADASAASASEANAAAAAEALAVAEAARAAKQQSSRQAWAGLLAKNKPPQCRHGEPAALLRVNKQGTNKGGLGLGRGSNELCGAQPRQQRRRRARRACTA